MAEAITTVIMAYKSTERTNLAIFLIIVLSGEEKPLLRQLFTGTINQ